MSKKNNNIEITLYEKVDMDILSKLVSSTEIEESLRQQLKNYYKNRIENDYIPVKYKFSKKLEDKGRLFALDSLSLQSLKKEIRHVLAKNYYHDIDMTNAQPVLILQYCEKRNIACEHLKNYVNNREEVLERVQKAHKINRDEAKLLILRLCYLGKYIIKKEDPTTKEIREYEPKKVLKILVDFRNELEQIAEAMCTIEKETNDLVQKDKDRKNKKATVLAITAQVLEHKCLMSMYKYFKNIKCEIGVLCFDGLMIRKDKKLKDMDNILEECCTFVKQKTGYQIKLVDKPMDMKLTIKLPIFSDYVESDLDAQKRLFLIEGGEKFKYCNEILYIYDEKTGLFEQQTKKYTTLNYYLIKNNHFLQTINDKGEIKGYGENAHLMKQVIPFVENAAKDNEWLLKTENSSLGYLLFKDGIYDMKKSKFQKGFDHTIVFHASIPWEFPEYDKEKIKEANKISFKVMFDKPKPIIAALARALAGDISIKKFYFCPGNPNAGKSVLINMLINAFGKYIGSFNAESLAQTSANDTKDEAAKLRWALLLRFCRILVSNEINMKRNMCGNQIKKHGSGGDKMIGRDHREAEISFTPHYTIFCMLNDIPKIDPMDKGVETRLEYLEFPHIFVDEKDAGKRTNYRKKDDNLITKINQQSFIEGFIHIILDGYKDYLKNGMPEFDKNVKEGWTAENKQNKEIIELIKERFEITNNEEDTVSVARIKKFREYNKDVFATISMYRFNEILRDELKLIEGKSGERLWKGIKEKVIKNVNNSDL